MLYLNHLSILRTNQRSCMVTVTEILTRLSRSFFYQRLTYYRFGVHSNECLHTVTTMYIQRLRYRTKTMSGIYISPMLHIIFQTPTQFVIFTILPVMIPERFQIMNISSLGTNDLPKHTLLCHIQSIHFKPVITAVLKDHTMFASLLAHIYQCPTLFQVHSRRNFDGDIFIILHRTHSDREMMQPICCDIHQIYIIPFTQFFVSFFT